MLDKYAEELRGEREKKGITLQQMAAKTRIDIKFLEAIDNGNFSFLPELYVKAFLKQYARVIGLDEQEMVQKYADAKGGKLEDRDEEKSILEQNVDVENGKEIEKDNLKTTLKQPEEKSEKPPLKTFSDVSSQKDPDRPGGRNKNPAWPGGDIRSGTGRVHQCSAVWGRQASPGQP